MTAVHAMGPGETKLLTERARFIREETVRLISIAQTGHYASSFSCAEIMATLYYGAPGIDVGRLWPRLRC